VDGDVEAAGGDVGAAGGDVGAAGGDVEAASGGVGAGGDVAAAAVTITTAATSNSVTPGGIHGTDRSLRGRDVRSSAAAISPPQRGQNVAERAVCDPQTAQTTDLVDRDLTWSA
jgi:hypothetical protein